MIPHMISHVAMKSFKRLRAAGSAVVITLLAFAWTDAQTATFSQDETGEQMTITGRLIGPDDKPVAGGEVAVVAADYRRSERPAETFCHNPVGGLNFESKVLATAKTDEEGRFRLSGPPYSASRPYARAILFAAAPSCGLTAHPIDHARPRQEATVKLQPEQVVRGRLIDLQGQPAVGVKLHYIVSGNQWDVPGVENCVPFWPKPVTTDDKGRFLLCGLGLPNAALEARHPRFARQRLYVEAGTPEKGKDTTLSLVAARDLHGRVTYADTGKPAAFVRVVAAPSDNGRFAGYNDVECRTDELGRFSLNTFPADYQMLILQPPEGSPYRTLRQMVPWAQAARQQLDFAFSRGNLVGGIVKEQSSGKPIAGARVQFRPRQNNNPFYRRETQRFRDEEHFEAAISGPDGRFQLGVLPGPGHLLVLGPTLDYLPVETSWCQLEGYSRPGGWRYYPDGLVALDTKPDAEPQEVTVELRRGVTLQGRVVGSDGKPVDRFLLLCRHYRPTGFSCWQRRNLLEGRDGRFELPGCGPEKPFTAWLLDPDHELGATVELSAKQVAGQPVTVRLERCGSAVAQFVDKDGIPLVNYLPNFSIVITPGASDAAVAHVGRDDKKDVEGDWLEVPFWKRSAFGRPMWSRNETDAEGKTTFRTLIPGATYRIASNILPKGGQDEFADKGWPTRDFTVTPGETLQILPEIIGEKQNVFGR